MNRHSKSIRENEPNPTNMEIQFVQNSQERIDVQPDRLKNMLYENSDMEVEDDTRCGKENQKNLGSQRHVEHESRMAPVRFSLLRKQEVQRNVMNAMLSNDGENNRNGSFSLLLIREQSQKSLHLRPHLGRKDANRDVMQGYSVPHRSNAARFTSKSINDDYNSVSDANELSSSKVRAAPAFHYSGKLLDEDEDLSRYFEDFIVRTIDRQKRAFKRGHRKQNNHEIFSCYNKIDIDYSTALTIFCERSELKRQNSSRTGRETEVSTITASSTNTVPYDNTSASAIKKKTKSFADEITIDSHLFAATHIFQQLLNVLSIVHSADKVFVKPSDDVVVHKTPSQVIYHDMEKYLLTQLSLVGTSDIKSITPGQASKLITWYYTYMHFVETSVFANSKSSVVQEMSPVWKIDIERLYKSYLEEGVRKEMQLLLSRIDNPKYMDDSEEDLRQTRVGALLTSLPEEIIYIVDLQVKVAFDCLPRLAYVVQVLEVCIDEISALVARKQIQIDMQWQCISLHRYCSIINDVSRLTELLNDYRAQIISKINESGREPISPKSQPDIAPKNLMSSVEERIDNCERELAELCMLTVEYLCRHIIYRIEQFDPIVTAIGSPTWESDSASKASNITGRMLGEFFFNVERWLTSIDYFFPKVLQKTFHLTVQSYVESFYINTMKTGLRQSRNAAVLLKSDYMILTKFFNSSVFENRTRAAGLLNNQDINAQLLVILSMSRIVDPTLSPTDLLDDTRNILERVTTCGENHATAILHLAGLRDGKHTKAHSIKWIRDIASAEQMLTDNSIVTNFMIRLPDLRNSPYIYKVRINQDDLQRQFSKSSLQYAQTTKDLVTGAGYKKQVQMYLVRKQQQVTGSNTTDAIIDGYRNNREKITQALLFKRKPGNGVIDS